MEYMYFCVVIKYQLKMFVDVDSWLISFPDFNYVLIQPLNLPYNPETWSEPLHVETDRRQCYQGRGSKFPPEGGLEPGFLRMVSTTA